MASLIIPELFVSKTISEQYATSTGAWANSGGTYDVATSGALADTYDANAASYLRWYAHHGGDGAILARQSVDYLWAAPCRVTSVYFDSYMGTFGGNYKEGYMHNYLYLYRNGGWEQVLYSGLASMPGVGSNAWAWRSWIASLATGWDGVTGVRMSQVQWSYSYEGNRQQMVDMHLNEVTVYAEVGGGYACII